MDPLDVYCADCLTDPGQVCTTINGNQCWPHAARVRLATSPAVCVQCAAEYGQPCYKTNGGVRMHPHQAREKAHANQ